MQLRDDRVALIVDTGVIDPAGTVCREGRESWAVFSVDPGSMARLARSGWLRQSRDAALPGEATARGCSTPAAEVHRVALPGDLGRRYGKVSGDRNPVHTRGLVARALGQRRPSVQGTCTANLVVAHAAARGRLAGLAIDFRRPLLVGQTVVLRLDDDGFDVRDSQGRLAAVGGLRWAHPSGRQPAQRPLSEHPDAR